MKNENISRLLKDGYPYEIIGSGGYNAVLVDVQPLPDHEYCAVYKYPGGTKIHSLSAVKSFQVVRQLPEGY